MSKKPEGKPTKPPEADKSEEPKEKQTDKEEIASEISSYDEEGSPDHEKAGRK